jgi:transposase-like protein
MARKKYSASRRTALLGLFARRTESIARFAKTHGVSAATLYKWQAHKEEGGGSFVEITREDKAPQAPHLLVRMGEVSLSFESLPDAGWLAALVQKLQG